MKKMLQNIENYDKLVNFAFFLQTHLTRAAKRAIFSMLQAQRKTCSALGGPQRKTRFAVRVLRAPVWNTAFEPRGRNGSKLRRVLPLQRSRATDSFRKQGGTVERLPLHP